MLRFVFLYLSHAAWAQKIILNWGLARRVALRFVAGETQAQALEAIRQLNARGMPVTADILGESVTEAAHARQTATRYCDLLDAIQQEKLDAWVSLKLTALGLDVDPDLCRENMRAILSKAREHGLHVTIDMEDHPYTDATLDLFREFVAEGFDNVRTVLQSYLFRTDADVEALVSEGAGLRLVKGAYREPASVAYPKKADVDAAFVRQMEAMLDASAVGKGYPGLATHDEKIIEQAKAYAAQKNIDPQHYEFQMLYGVRTTLQEQLIADGYRMRVYVPYGTEWYPYLMRRLAERPANMWFFASNLVRR